MTSPDYGDTIRSKPAGPERDLAGLEYQLSITTQRGDHAQAAVIAGKIAELRAEHPDLE
ncbi:MAG: hypothetical protein IE935_11620 [Micrococcales bacterium]|nr:hypothetical protein [Micrococcales bacterium]